MKYFINYISLFFVGVTLVWLGCSKESESFSTVVQPEGQTLMKKSGIPAVEVAPVFRLPTGKNSERLTVFVFFEKGGNGKGGGDKPGGGKPSGNGSSCSDPNNNQDYNLLGVTWPHGGISVDYQSAFEPEAVIDQAFPAVDLAIGSWEVALNSTSFINCDINDNAPLPPARDDSNVIGWRQLVGKDARKVLAATYIWDDGNGFIIEADIVYNTAQDWTVNLTIAPGDNDCGTDFDVQAIGTHEIGHFIGLGHVDIEDATMFGSAGKGELKKQTLTPGDMDGAVAVSSPAS
jgi:hypothetical protein